MGPSSSMIDRRDWLKAAAVGGLATLMPPDAEAAQAAKPRGKAARGVVFMVADGMSPGVLTLAESFSRLTRKRGTAWLRLMEQETTCHGLMDTASASSMVTDSAAASSAWGGGQRVKNGEINVDASGREIAPIAAILKKERACRVGLVTTATVTHATPAGFAASVTARGKEPDIAPQYLDRVDVILGGGSGFFRREQRPDKRDLAADFVKVGYQQVAGRGELLASRSERLLGTFTPGHLPFFIDRLHDATLAARIPSLAEMATAALTRFLADDKPFLLQVEGARVDHAAHLNDIAGLLHDQLEFDDALAAVLAGLAGRDDVLVVVTSDHGNANPGVNGTGNSYGETDQRFRSVARMKASHESILKQAGKLAKADVPAIRKLVRGNLDFDLGDEEAEALLAMLKRQPVIEWSHQHFKPEGLLGQFAGNHTAIGWTGTSHTSDPTIVTASGPGAASFAGMIPNTRVFRNLAELLA